MTKPLCEKRPGKTSTRHILCVDDELPTLEARKLLLESEGYSVRTVTSGEEALWILDEGVPLDLVLLEYVMTGMNGDELAEKLREGVVEKGTTFYFTLSSRR